MNSDLAIGLGSAAIILSIGICLFLVDFGNNLSNKSRFQTTIVTITNTVSITK